VTPCSWCLVLSRQVRLSVLVCNEALIVFVFWCLGDLLYLLPVTVLGLPS
jgi:hypothetical protein